MAKSSKPHFVVVTGTGNTGIPGYVSIAGGVKDFIDDTSIASTIEGSGQKNIVAWLALDTGVPVTYFTGGGNGTVVGGGAGDSVVLSGTKWVFEGYSQGAATVADAAGAATISVAGQGSATGNATGPDSTPSNFVELAGAMALVNSSGSNDLIESFAGSDTVKFSGSGNLEINGGNVTVNAAGSGPVRAIFAGNGGGTLDFINNSSVSATVSGNIPGGSGGSATVFGGVGGGVYVGGAGGNNSLIGGSGNVTLVGAGTNNYLEAAGFASSYASQNVLEAGSGGGVLIADSTTGYNQFYGGTGNSTISTAGAGAQTFYVGASGTEYITGSTAAGSTNEYIFNQNSTGSGQDTIANFRLGRDHIDVNLNGTLSGVTIAGISTIGGGQSGTIVNLSDKTQIYLYGVSPSALSTSIIGGTHI
jgi:hypothetical protein